MTVRNPFDYVVRIENCTMVLERILERLFHPAESKFFTLKKYCELTGDTPAAVHSRRKNGKWKDGDDQESFISPDGNIWVNLVKAQLWITKNYRQSANGVKRPKRRKA